MPSADSITRALFVSLMKLTSLKRKSSSWYQFNDATIGVINLQRSSWGPQYYINCGVLVRQLDQIEFPKEHQCHLRCRIESLWKDFPPGALDDESDLDVHARDRALREAIQQHLLPQLDRWRTYSGIAKSMKSDTFRHMAPVRIKKFLTAVGLS